MGLILLNGTAYSGYDEPSCVYSEEEREIGVWIDGKPLYQKTVHIVESAEQSDVVYTTEITSLNPDYIKLVNAEVKLGSNGNNKWYTAPFNVNNTYYMGVSVCNSEMEIISKTWKYSEAYVTVQYTKTTDIPGSGKWASNGALAKHYSLQEQVIGTWIDGKPIYEITFDFYDDIDWNISYNVWNGTGKYIQNCGRILKATCSSNSGVYTEVMAYSDSDHIKVQTPRNGDSTQCRYLTIQYTKTTD